MRRCRQVLNSSLQAADVPLDLEFFVGENDELGVGSHSVLYSFFDLKLLFLPPPFR